MTNDKTPFQSLKIGPDGWAHGVRTGEYLVSRPADVLDPQAAKDAPDTEVTEVVDAEACAKMLAAFKAEGAELLVDADHSADLSSDTAAYAWVTDMRPCADGLEVLLRLTDLGQKAMDGNRYRYLSPVFEWPDFEYLDEARTKGRPTRAARFGLTNLPRMRGIRPVVNARPACGAVNATTTTPPKGKAMDYRSKLLSLLGLAPEATDAEIQTALDAALAAQADATAEDALNAAGIAADSPARAGLKAACNADLASGRAAIRATAAALNAGRPAQRALNAADGRTPALNAAHAAKSAQRQAALNSLLAQQPGLDRSAAWNHLKRTSPELF